jgi:hypothetical protein
LLGLLWPDNDTESARANLRRTLSGLRKTISVDFLEVGRIQLAKVGIYHLLASRELQWTTPEQLQLLNPILENRALQVDIWQAHLDYYEAVSE